MYETDKTERPQSASGSLGGSAIIARGAGKAYRMYDKPVHRLWDLILPGGPRGREFWAVRDVYLDIPQGATVGIIGENGAGIFASPDPVWGAVRAVRVRTLWPCRDAIT